MAGTRGLGGGRVFADLPELETERLRKMRLDTAEAMFAYASEVTRYVLWRTPTGCSTSGPWMLSPPVQRISSVPSL